VPPPQQGRAPCDYLSLGHLSTRRRSRAVPRFREPADRTIAGIA